MSNYITDPSDDTEQYRIEDNDGDLFAVMTYFGGPAATRYGFEDWVVDFANGDRLTGGAANEVAKRFLNKPGTDGEHGSRFDQQADTLLDTVVYDDDARMYRITVRGVRVWFWTAKDSGNGDVVLYADATANERAGVIEDAPFDAGELKTACDMEQRRVADHA